jgi:hypothetical protein
VMVLSPMGKKKFTRLLASMDVLGFVHSMYLDEFVYVCVHVCTCEFYVSAVNRIRTIV